MKTPRVIWSYQNDDELLPEIPFEYSEVGINIATPVDTAKVKALVAFVEELEASSGAEDIVVMLDYRTPHINLTFVDEDAARACAAKYKGTLGVPSYIPSSVKDATTTA